MTGTHCFRSRLAGRTALLIVVWVATVMLDGCAGSSQGNGSNSGSAAVASITVSPSAPSVALNGSKQFSATAKDGNGNAVSGVTFKWASSATSVATINGSGLATAAGTGTTQITASADGVTSQPDTLTVTGATSSVTGTAAQGSPVASASVTLKDAKGNSQTATTASDGTFTVNTTGLTPPYLLKVQPGSGNPMYSVSADAKTSTTINIDPLTDLIVRSWYSAEGASVDTAFANPVSMPAPSPASVQVLTNAVTNLAQLWLNNAGVNTSQFNLISTPFTANGKGLDQVLNETKVNTAAGTVTIAGTIGNAATTQTSTITYNTSAGTMTVATTTTNSNGTSVSSNTTVVPIQTAQQTALSGINTTFTNFINAVNSNGSQLTAAEITPFLASNLLNDALNQTQYAAELVTHMRGTTISSAQIQTVKSLDLANGVADIVFNLSNASQAGPFEAWFEEVSGAWLLGGDNRIVQINSQVAARTSEGSQTQGALGTGVYISADLWAQEGAVSSVTVTDPSGITGWNSTPIPMGTTIVETFQPTPTTQLQVDLQQFDLGWLSLGSSIIPAGTLFTYAVTTTSGPVDNYTWPSNVFTTELISITSANSTSPPSGSLSDYPAGVPLPLTWTLPTTFAIANVAPNGEAYTGTPGSQSTYECEISGQTSPPVGSLFSTSGTITFPATCNGLPVVFEELHVGVTGVNGEVESATVNIQ